MPARIRVISSFAALLLLSSCTGAPRNPPSSSSFTTASATQVDESHLVTLAGNVLPLAHSAIDLGAIPASTRLDRMILVLDSSPAQQSALNALVEALQNPASSRYHQWLTPAEFGAEFGPSESQVALVAGWLTAHGFTLEEIPAGRRSIIFSGTAGQVASAFHTVLHRYNMNGSLYIANASDPEIPAALAGVVGGVVTLNDFRRAPQFGSEQPPAVRPEYSAGGTHYLFPADFASIYDLNSLYAAGVAGTGTAIAIAGRSNINLSDVAGFRAIAGLAANTPSVIVYGTDPGLVASDQTESTLGVEWSGAVAPAAQLDLVVAASTASTDGIDLASSYIVNHAIAPIVSVSYATCEQNMGAAELAFYNDLWEQAASQGMSVFVSSGDAGAAGCQQADSAAGAVAAVNGLCSSPYATCVGGTEFNEGANPGQYWSPVNSSAYGSALGYIPEEVWNESGLDGGMGLWASGGGASVVYTQPAWQQNVSGAGAAGGMRAVPDVSLSAANHDGYLMVENGASMIVSGTSVAAPAFAGLMALVADKSKDNALGSVNSRLYALASAAPDLFHPTLSGDNSVPGVAGFAANGATYNLATGLGSVDGALLVNGWSRTSPYAPPTLTLSAMTQTATIPAGGSASMRFTVGTGGAFAGGVSLSVSSLPRGVSAAWSTNPLTPAAGTSSVSLGLAAALGAVAGSSRVVATAAGDGLVATQIITVAVTKRVAGCARFSLMPVTCRPSPQRTIQ